MGKNLLNDAPKFLITGGLGQLGPPLSLKLAKYVGSENVILSDIASPKKNIKFAGQFTKLDVKNTDKIAELVEKERVTYVVHLAAYLSGLAELRPDEAIALNINTTYPILNIAKKYNLKLFLPSTIGAFGPESPLENTPDVCIQKPKSIYGISKVYAELLGEYFNKKFGVDFRCLRYPGIISGGELAGHGTTDYACAIFENAYKYNKYECYLKEDTRLPMMHINDCIDGTVQFLLTDNSKLNQRVYNLGAINFTPQELTEELTKRYFPSFSMTYKIDPVRQNLANQWPKILDDKNARNDWGWSHQYDLGKLIECMIKEASKNNSTGQTFS